MDLELLINKYHNKFSEIDSQICNFILNHKSQISKMSITDLAFNSYTSKSSVLRFVQKLGFSGYSQFKYIVNWNDADDFIDSETLHENLSNNLKSQLDKVKKNNLKLLFDTITNSNNIYLIATGLNQQYQALDLQRNFLRAGINMIMLPSLANSDISISVNEKINENDLMIVFSSSGENESIKDMLAIPIIKNVKIVSFTVSGDNWVEKLSIINFSLGSENLDKSITHFSSGLFHLIIDYIILEYENYLKEKLINRVL